MEAGAQLHAGNRAGVAGRRVDPDLALVAFAISPVIPSLAARYVGDEVAPRLEPALEQTPPDAGALRKQVGSLTGETNVEMVPERDGGGLDLSGSRGRLRLRRRRRPAIARLQPPGGAVAGGERFDAERFPGLAPLMAAALRGEEDRGAWRVLARK